MTSEEYEKEQVADHLCQLQEDEQYEAWLDKIDERNRALDELAEQAQELDMGY